MFLLVCKLQAEKNVELEIDYTKMIYYSICNDDQVELIMKFKNVA